MAWVRRGYQRLLSFHIYELWQVVKGLQRWSHLHRPDRDGFGLNLDSNSAFLVVWIKNLEEIIDSSLSQPSSGLSVKACGSNSKYAQSENLEFPAWLLWLQLSSSFACYCPCLLTHLPASILISCHLFLIYLFQKGNLKKQVQLRHFFAPKPSMAPCPMHRSLQGPVRMTLTTPLCLRPPLPLLHQVLTSWMDLNPPGLPCVGHLGGLFPLLEITVSMYLHNPLPHPLQAVA